MAYPICAYYPFCKFSGNKCHFEHPICIHYNRPSGCRYGLRCRNKHIQLVKPVLDLERLEGQTIGNYKLIKNLGSGTYSHVWLATDLRSEKLVAIKICTGYIDILTKNEIEVFTSLQKIDCNDVLVQMIETFPHPTDKEGSCIVMEFLQYVEIDESSVTIFNKSMNLYDFIYIKKIFFTTKMIDSIIAQIANGLMKLNQAGYIHADLKPENILITKFNSVTSEITIKICDFGIALSIYDSRYTLCQSQFYRAHEVLTKQRRSITKAIDMWSLGCIIWEMIEGNPLFLFNETKESEHNKKIMHIENSDYIETHIKKSFEKYSLLIKGLLNIDPTKRNTAEQVLQSM
jgi:serine/threonine protein kinase